MRILGKNDTSFTRLYENMILARINLKNELLFSILRLYYSYSIFLSKLMLKYRPNRSLTM